MTEKAGGDSRRPFPSMTAPYAFRPPAGDVCLSELRARAFLGDQHRDAPGQHDGSPESLVEMRGPLRIGCSHSLSPRLMPGLVDHFVSKHPLVDVGFREGAPSVLQEDVRNGRLDVALVYEQQADDDLEHAAIAKVRLHVVLSARHELAGRPSIHLAEIAHEQAILLDVPRTVERLTAVIQAAGVEPRICWTSSNMETIRAMVARGLGYSFMNPPPSGGTTYEGGEVVFIPLADRRHPHRRPPTS